MSSIGDINNIDVLTDVRLRVFNLLRVLKFFYSFKELEKYLEVPSQVLWRYVTFRSSPEKTTAYKILNKIKEKKLIENIVSNLRERPHLLLSNPGILELAAIKAFDEFKKDKVNVVLSAPDSYSIALASLISVYLKSRLCIPSRMPYVRELSNNYIIEPYLMGSSLIEIIAIPRECLPLRSRVLIVVANIQILEPLLATINLALKRHADIVGIFSLIGSKEAISKIEYKLPSKSKIVVTLPSYSFNLK